MFGIIAFGCFWCGRTGYITDECKCGKCGRTIDMKYEMYVYTEKLKEHKNNHSYWPAYDDKDGAKRVGKGSKYSR